MPPQLTTFIGRGREIGEVKRLILGNRLVTLTGAGGCGKTRLALQVADTLLKEFPGGVWMVDLAPLANPAFVPRAVAAALGFPEQPDRRLQDTLADSLRPRALLLLLDNCEHVLTVCADLAHALLRECPGLRILTTSREPLGVGGEIRWRVPPLSLPDLRHLPAIEDLTKYDAVRLFLDRAVAAHSEFAITNGNARTVAQLCQQLDGIPLAIEMAAAWVRVLTVEEIIGRLTDRFRLLSGGDRAVLPRHQTLKTAMDWSYELLSEPERILLSRLSVFAGGWTLEAAEAVCSGRELERSELLGLLTRLVDKSLVLAETGGGTARYRLLETIREYGETRLRESGEVAEVRTRHRDWYRDFAERTEPKLRGPEQVARLERLETEHDNLRAALEWGKARGDHAEAQLRLAGALAWFWFMRGYWSEGREWLEGGFATDRGVPPSVRAKALCGAGILTWRQGDWSRAGALLQKSVDMFHGLRDEWGRAFSLHHLAHVSSRQGDHGRGVALLEESVAVFRELGDTWGIAWSLRCLGDATFTRGDYGRAEALLREAVPFSREAGDPSILSYTLALLGRVAMQQGDYPRATALLEEGFATARQLGDKYLIPYVQYWLAHVSLSQGDGDRALALYEESLDLRRNTGDKSGLADCLEGFARVACTRGHHERATRLLGAAEGFRDTFALPRARFEQDDYDRCVASAHAALGEESFGVACAEGRMMTLEKAVEYALTPPEVHQPKSQEPTRPAPGKRGGLLAPREREVALLISEGKTNREIATRLSITEGTVEAHVQHILNKLGFNTRAQIAAWVATRRLRATSPTDG